MNKPDVNRITLSRMVTASGIDEILVAQPADATKENLCDGCYYENDFKGCRIAPVCTSTLREDNQNVIWVKEYTLEDPIFNLVGKIDKS